jgi:hypothetical protein
MAISMANSNLNKQIKRKLNYKFLKQEHLVFSVKMEPAFLYIFFIFKGKNKKYFCFTRVKQTGEAIRAKSKQLDFLNSYYY